MTNERRGAGIDHEAIRTGSIPWSAEELEWVIERSESAEEALHVAAARAKELGLDMTSSIAHGMRLFAIMDLLKRHKDRLYEIGLLLPSEPGKDVMSGHLIDVLATFPFTLPTGETSAGGKPALGFDADDVIIEAGRRQALEDAANEAEGR